MRRSKPSRPLLFGLGALLGFVLVGCPLGAFALLGAFDQEIDPTPPPGTQAVQAAQAEAESWLCPASSIIGPIATPVSPASAEEVTDWKTEAEGQMQDENYGRALVLWDQVIRHSPGDHQAYFNRALSYLELTWNQRSLEEYREYNCLARQDSNVAIDLADRPIGDYYYTRFRAYDNLSKTVEYRVDQEQLSEIALENMMIALDLPNRYPWARTGLPYMLVRLGRYAEAQSEVARQIAERGEGAAPNAGLHNTLGYVLMHQGDYPAALEHTQIALSICPPCTNYKQQRIEILYHMGQAQQALAELDALLAESPDYAGDRYVLRALMEQEMGDTQAAMRDLDLGMANSWGRGGLRFYVLSLAAEADGRHQEAVQLLQQAEATMFRDAGAFLERIQAELAQLGASPSQVTASAWMSTTPIPPLPADVPRARPPLRLPHSASTGPIRLQPDETLDIHFVPETGYSPAWISSLRLYLLSYRVSLVENVEVWAHSDDSRSFERINGNKGDYYIGRAGRYISNSGEILFRIHNLGSQELYLDDVGMVLEAIRADGLPLTYGFHPPAPTPTLPRPTSTPRPTPDLITIPEGAVPADPEAGTGPLTLVPGQDYVFHFQLGPGTPASIQSTERLVIYLLGSSPAEERTYIHLETWDHVRQGWGTRGGHWGENVYEGYYPGSQLVSNKGDLVIRLNPYVDWAIEIDNLLVTAVVRDQEGNTVTYGYGSG